MMLHTKYQGSWPSGLREDCLCFHNISQCITCGLRVQLSNKAAFLLYCVKLYLLLYFVYLSNKALVRLRGCAASYKPSMLEFVSMCQVPKSHRQAHGCNHAHFLFRI